MTQIAQNPAIHDLLKILIGIGVIVTILDIVKIIKDRKNTKEDEEKVKTAN